jgi:hypothetical protein
MELSSSFQNSRSWGWLLRLPNGNPPFIWKWYLSRDILVHVQNNMMIEKQNPITGSIQISVLYRQHSSSFVLNLCYLNYSILTSLTQKHDHQRKSANCSMPHAVLLYENQSISYSNTNKTLPATTESPVHFLQPFPKDDAGQQFSFLNRLL